MNKQVKKFKYFPFEQLDVIVEAGDIVAWIANRWTIGIVLRVFGENDPWAMSLEPPMPCNGGYLVLLDGGGKVIFDEYSDDELVFLQHTTWYDEDDWMVCEKMKSVDEVMKHFGVERMWGN